MSAIRLVPVTAFVDWNAQIHNLKLPKGSSIGVAEKTGRTLSHIGRVLGRVLSSIDVSARFNVSLRLYHGWHKGFEPTDNRRALATAAAAADFSALSAKVNVSIRPEIAYGDRLLSGLDTRLHARLGIHLPDTLRPERWKKRSEKMVDTAIATDIVDLAHREPDRWIVVMGEDDDLVPPVYAAEAIRGERQGRVLLVRKQAAGPFLKLEGVLVRT